MNKKFLLIGLLALSLGVVAGCGGKGSSNSSSSSSSSSSSTSSSQNVEKTSIESILTATNNTPVHIEGVVYAITSQGIYVADSAAGRIIVNGTHEVAIGDKVDVTGRFGLTAGVPQVKQATVTKTGTGTSPVVASAKTIEEVAEIDPSLRTSYGQLVTVTGVVSFDNEYILTDDEGNTIAFENSTQATEVLANVTGRVAVTALVSSYQQSNHTSPWKLYFFGGASDVVDAALTFADLKGFAAEHIGAAVPTSIYGTVSLPTTHKIFNYLTYSWEVEANEAISISENVATVSTELTSDVSVTLKYTVTDGTSSETVDYPVTIKVIDSYSVSQLRAAEGIEGRVVKLNGIVVMKNHSQSATQPVSVVLKDKTTAETFAVSFSHTYEGYASIKLGDEITVCGFYSEKAPTNQVLRSVYNVLSHTVDSTGNVYEHDYEHAYVVNDQASFDYLAAHYDELAGTLIKWENPFVKYSVSSAPGSSNWVQLYPTQDGGKGAVNGSEKTFSLQIGGNSDVLGTDIWHEYFDIPLSTGTITQFGFSFYAYPMYVTGSYASLFIPEMDAFEWPSAADEIKANISGLIPTSATDVDVIDLAQSYTIGEEAVAITWTSSNQEVLEVSGNKALPKAVSEATEVTLTATFTIGEGEPQTVVYEITVMSNNPLQVSEVVDIADGTNIKVEGIVVGFHGNNSISSAGNKRMGYILMDPVTGELLLTNGSWAIAGSDKFGDNLMKASDGSEVEIGDKIIVTGAYTVSSAFPGTVSDANRSWNADRDHLLINETSTLTVVSKNNSTTPVATNIVEVDSQEDLAALVATGVPYGTTIKFVGTPESPFYLRSNGTKYSLEACGTNTTPSTFRFSYNGSTVGNDDGKFESVKEGENGYEANLHFGIVMLTNQMTFGGEDSDRIWWKEIGYAGTEGSSASTRAFVGSFYATITYTSSTFYHITFIDPSSFEVASPSAALDAIPSTVVGGTTLEINYPTALKNPVLTSSNPAVIDAETGVVANVSEETVVTLTLTGTIGGQQVTSSKEVTVSVPVEKVLTISELYTQGLDGVALDVEGVVIGHVADTNSTKARYGLLVADTTTGKSIAVHGLAGTHPEYVTTGETPATIKIGDKVKLSDVTYYTSSDHADATAGIATGRAMLLVGEDTLVEVVSSDNPIALPNATETVTDAASFIKAFAEVSMYDVIKFEASAENNLFAGQSSKTDASANAYLHYFAGSTGLANGETIVSVDGQDVTVSGGKTAIMGPGETKASARAVAVSRYNECISFFNLSAGAATSKSVTYTGGELYAVVTHITNTYVVVEVIGTPTLTK